MIAAYEAGEELPQAVISANDLMAAAFLQTIKGTALDEERYQPHGWPDPAF